MNDAQLARIMASVNEVIDAYEGGKLQSPANLMSGLTTLRGCLSDLEDLADDRPNALEARAITHQLTSSLQFELGQIDECILELYAADRAFQAAQVDSRRYAMFLHDATVTLHQIGLPAPKVMEWGERAREAMQRHGLHKSRFGRPPRFHYFLQSVASGQGENSDQLIKHLRRRLRWARPRDRADTAQALGVTILESGARDPAATSEIHHCLRTAFRNSLRQGRLEDATTALGTLVDLHWEGLSWPEWSDDAALELCRVASRAQRSDLASVGHIVHGLGLLRGGDPQASLTPLLMGVVSRDEYALTTDTSIVRMLTGRRTEYARQFALEAAVQLHNHDLVVELIESARLQVLPALENDDPFHEGLARVTGLRPVGWDGRSALAPLYRTPVGEVIDLRRCLDKLAGPDALWFGCWWANARIYWCLSGPAIRDSGSIDVSPGTSGHTLLLHALEATPQGTQDWKSMLTGPWSRNSMAEELMATELGELLIPGSLAASLRGASEAAPVQLVISGNLLASIPAGLLAVRVGDFESARVVERAIVRVAPPAIIVDGIQPCGGSPGGRRHIKIACVDPTGDLPFSSAPPPGAQLTLSGTSGSDYSRPTAR